MASAIGKTIIREIEASITGNKFRLGYKNPQKSFDMSMEDAIRHVVSGKYAPTEAQCDVEIEPLSLNCAAPSNVVFTLSAKDNFQFATDADPIQFKDGANKDRYANFCRVAPDGTAYPFGKPYGSAEPCKMVTFEATAPTANYIDRFNFVVDVIHENKPGKKSPLRLLIDPDIRNPGGSGG